MFLDVPEWFWMVLDAAGWSWIVQVGAWWSWMVLFTTGCSRMVLNCPGCGWVVLDGFEWPWMDYYDFKDESVFLLFKQKIVSEWSEWCEISAYHLDQGTPQMDIYAKRFNSLVFQETGTWYHSKLNDILIKIQWISCCGQRIPKFVITMDKWLKVSKMSFFTV